VSTSAWVLVWVVLALGAALYLAKRSWTLWRQVGELIAELGLAAQRIGGVQGQLQLLEDQVRDPSQLAVFGSPAALRRERQRPHRSLVPRKRRRSRSPRPSRGRDVH